MSLEYHLRLVLLKDLPRLLKEACRYISVGVCSELVAKPFEYTLCSTASTCSDLKDIHVWGIYDRTG